MTRTVILAAGDFPARGSEPWRLLASAARVIACDSAAIAFRRSFRRWPDLVVGDLDSLGSVTVPPGRLVRLAGQDDNDLDKAIGVARARGWEDIVVVGATGRREDHAIGNVYRALSAGVRLVSEFGEFLPVGGRAGTRLTFKTWKGAGISVFAPDQATRMTSRGLGWKLDGVSFVNAYCATLNRATAERVVVTSDRPAFVYVERPTAVVRAVVSLGSNVGNRRGYLARALRALAAMPETRLADASSVIETEPVDVPTAFASLRFLNQAAVFETTLEPLAFSRAMHAIEDRLGRVRTVRNGPRTIDIDLITFGNLVMETPELTLPHPRAKARDFVRLPLKELGLSV